MNAQIDSLKAKLREAGVELDNYGTPRGEMTLYQARKGGQQVNLLINDLGEDGYTLRMEVPGIRIDEDVEAILSKLEEGAE